MNKERFVKSYQEKFFDGVTEASRAEPHRSIYFGKDGYFLFCKFLNQTEKVLYFPYYKSDISGWITYIDAEIDVKIIEKPIEALLTHKSNVIRRFAEIKIKEIREEK